MQKRERIEPGQQLASFDHRYPLNWRAMVLKILSELFITITDTNRFDIRDKRFNTETLCFVELSLFCILDYSPILHCVKGTNCLDGLEFMASSVECLVALKAVVLVYWNGKISLGWSFIRERIFLFSNMATVAWENAIQAYQVRRSLLFLFPRHFVNFRCSDRLIVWSLSTIFLMEGGESLPPLFTLKTSSGLLQESTLSFWF